MDTVLLTAFCVGGATIVGGAVGLLFRGASKKFQDATMSFAAGVMLCASIISLILPSTEYGGRAGVFITVFGMLFGAILVHFLDLLVPFASKMCNLNSAGGDRVRRVFVFVMAIALHNLPEGIAAGVGLGTDDPKDAFLIAAAITMQNIPEGIIVTAAMLGVGARRMVAFATSTLTGVIEIAGTLLGFFAITVCYSLLPFVLATAGGAMLYVISEEMIPETHTEESGKISTYFLLLGFSLILVFNALL